MAKMNEKEREFAARVAELGCTAHKIMGATACEGNIEINHVSKGSGMGRKNPHWAIHGLCYQHHRGRYGLHHLGTAKWEQYFGDQWDHVKWVYDQLGLPMPELTSKIVKRK